MNIDRLRQALDELDRSLSPVERDRLKRYGSVAQVYMIYLTEILRQELDSDGEAT